MPTCASAARGRTVQLALVGSSGHVRTFSRLAAIADGQYVRARLTGARASDVIATLRTATRGVSLQVTSLGAEPDVGVVLLTGAAAALSSLDAQERVSSSEMKPPLVAAKRMTEIAKPPATALPPGLRTPDGPACRDAGELWIRLSPQRTLRGICTDAGAYNISYQFYFIGPHQSTLANFFVPWRKHDAASATLVNPNLSRDGMTIGSYAKDVGYGGCGEASDWVWTGSEFRLLRLSAMRQCRGVPDDDWPVLFEARRT